MKFGRVLRQCTLLYRRPYPRHVLLVEVEIVDGAQLRAEDFVALVQVMQIGAGKVRTGVTIAVWI